MTKIVNISEFKNKSNNYTLQNLMEQFEDTIKEDKCNKALVIFLDDKEDKYNIGFTSLGLPMSECIPLLDITKSLCQKEMGY